MSRYRKFYKCVFLVLSLIMCVKAAADSRLSSQQFIDMALTKSISEIETAKIALEKSSSAEVTAYAHVVLEEQARLVNSLRKLAQQEHLRVPDEPELQAKARVFIFQRNGKNFEAAYAEMRSAERRKAVGLYRAAAMLSDNNIKQYATQELPVLMRHLYMAQALVGHLGDSAVLISANAGRD